MSKMRVFTKIGLAWALPIVHAACFAQASLIAENMVDSVSVPVKAPDGSIQDQVYTLVRDARVPEQWYYFPSQPRLAEAAINGDRVPELNFIRYTSSTADGQLNSAGLLTFSVTLGASVDALDGMKKKLKEIIKERGQIVPADIRLSSIPLNSATAAVFSPTTGQLLAEGGANSIVTASDGAAPTNAGNKIVFALMLSDVGTDVYKALLDGVGGIPVWIRYKFNGLTPPAGFKVTANWDQAYEHYSKNEQFRARASYFGWFSANYSSDRTYIRDELLKSSAIKVEAVTGGSFTQETLDNYLQPIVKRLNDTILQDLTPPTKIDPAKAGTPDSGGFFGGAGYSVAIKDVKDVRKGSETWDFSFSSIQERGGSADGTIGLQIYPESTRKRLVQEIDAGSANWARVYLPMPNVGKLDSAELRARLKYNSSIVAERYFKWSERLGWVNVQGNQPVNGVWISLLGQQNFDKKNAFWENQYQFSLGEYTISANAKTPLEGDFDGAFAPADLVRILTVSGDGLNFEDSAGASKLISVDVTLNQGDKVASRTFKRETNAAGAAVTNDLKWIIPASVNGQRTPVSAKITGNYANGKQCKKEFDSKAFADRFSANNVQLRTLGLENCE